MISGYPISGAPISGRSDHFVTVEISAGLDAYIVNQAGVTVGAGADAALMVGGDTSLDMDGALQLLAEAGVDIDALVERIGVVGQADVDAALEALGQARSFLADGLLQAVETGSTDVDTLLKAQGAASQASIESALARIGQLKTIAMDANLDLAGTEVTAMDGALARIGADSSMLVDAALISRAAVGFVADVALKGVAASGVDIDGALQTLGLPRGAVVDGALSAAFDAGADLSGVLIRTTGRDVGLDAPLLGVSSVVAALDALYVYTYTTTTFLSATLCGIEDLGSWMDALVFPGVPKHLFFLVSYRRPLSAVALDRGEVPILSFTRWGPAIASPQGVGTVGYDRQTSPVRGGRAPARVWKYN